MSQTISLLYPPGYDREKVLKLKDCKFIKPLQIDDMVVLVKESYRGLSNLSLENYFE
jgi:hypothetical protein